MWVFSAVPEKMLMVYTMVFGAHLLPYSWLYKSRTYFVFAILIPILALVLGHMASMTYLSLVMVFLEIVFAMLLQVELNANKKLKVLSCLRTFYKKRESPASGALSGDYEKEKF